MIMGENVKNNLIYTVTICAVIFGADETLLNVNIGNGFAFRKMSLIPVKDDLHKIFQSDTMGLRKDYEAACIGKDTLDLICVFKSYKISLNRIEAEMYYRKMCDEVLKYLDDSIRVIRLLSEGPVRFNKLSIKMDSEIEIVDETKTSHSFSSIIPIGEAMKSSAISKFHCEDKEIKEINNNISLIKFPLDDELLNNCHRYYDLSYNQDNFISITLLITCLEILFLDNEDAKKERLAKRCSVFLYDAKEERINCYDNLKEAYKKRSEFVHNGNCIDIKNGDILFLRDCIRKSLMKYLNNLHNKKCIIKELRTNIKYLGLDYWSRENQ
jgi:hypothetical protein